MTAGQYGQGFELEMGGPRHAGGVSGLLGKVAGPVDELLRGGGRPVAAGAAKKQRHDEGWLDQSLAGEVVDQPEVAEREYLELRLHAMVPTESHQLRQLFS